MKKKYVVNLFFALSIIVLKIGYGQQPVITGDLMQYHKITFTWTSLNTSEALSTFKDYRLNVVFTSPSGISYLVPGYYAADGNSGETSATSGDKWRCHFNALEVGQWSYNVSFKTGTNIAASLDANVGVSAGAIDESSGNFNVSITNKTGVDFRSKGKLEYVGEHHMRWTNDEYFLKMGTNSPETFLSFADFDNTNATRTYPTHVADWNVGDPLWKGDKGKGIIGAVNYLNSEDMNVQYFLPYRTNFDPSPWVNHVDDKVTIDVSKMDQWQIVFDHMMTKGVMPHFVLSESTNQSMFEQLVDAEGDSNFADARKVFYREMIARFGYLNAITWNIGEENGWNRNSDWGRALTTQQQKDFAEFIDALACYNDHITVHNGHAFQDFIYEDLVGDNSFTGISNQGVVDRNETARDRFVKWRKLSVEAGKKWIINYDEPFSNNGHLGITEENFRNTAVWSNLVSGGAGVEHYFPLTDASEQDYRVWSAYWEIMDIAQDFFLDNNIHYWEMDPKDDAVNISSGWILGKDNESYVIYLNEGGSTTLNIANDYTVQWYDPRVGGELQNGSVTNITSGTAVSVGDAPSDITEDWVVLLTAIVVNNVTGVTVSPSTSTLEVGETETLVATVTPSNADNSNVSWSSSNSSIATVDTNGEVTAIATGTASITVTTADGGFTAESIITVPAPAVSVTGVSVSPSTITLEIGETGTLAVTVSPTNADDGSVSWSSSNTSIATVDTNGEVTAITAGSAVITVTTMDGGFTAESIITVPAPEVSVTGVSISPSTITLEIGEAGTLAVTVSPTNADDVSVSWSSSNTSIATVDANGEVTAIGAGIATINVTTTDGGFTAESIITVPAPEVSVTGVSISPSTITLEIDESENLVATVSPSNSDNSGVGWSSSNSSIATVDTNGEVTAIAAGNAAITVTTADGGFSAETLVVVSQSQTIQLGEILNFVLVDAQNRVELFQLTDGMQINLTDLPVRDLTIKANTSEGVIGSVQFELNGGKTHSSIQNLVPFALYGLREENYVAQSFEVGSYSLIATTYSGSNSEGDAGTPFEINFDIIENTEDEQEIDENQLMLYPNPVEDILTIEFYQANASSVQSIYIYSLNRKLIKIFTGTSIETNENSNQINVTGIQSGLYLVIILNNNGDTYNHKIIKM